MKKLSCESCGAPLSYEDGRWACEYCGTPYQTPEEATDGLIDKGMTVELWKEINERMRRSDKISFAPAEEVIVIRTEEDKRRLLMDAAYLSPETSGNGIAYFHGKRVIWEV